jgi:single-strand selective monofunctional uracil DNA glycosylase
MPPSTKTQHPLVAISRKLRTKVEQLRFAEPVTHVYDPLDYAREPHETYLERYGNGKKRVLFLGMNPGPFGMAQNGVPFGDTTMVRDYLGITGKVTPPSIEHPKRPVQGFACKRSEVSGTRLWGWIRERFPEPSAFFERAFVVNYCPLVFMEASSKNRTPNQLPAEEREALFGVCDEALVATVKLLEPTWVVGVGAFAQARAAEALAKLTVRVETILHPSPASPRANKGWAREAERDLAEASVEL